MCLIIHHGTVFQETPPTIAWIAVNVARSHPARPHARASPAKGRVEGGAALGRRLALPIEPNSQSEEVWLYGQP